MRLSERRANSFAIPSESKVSEAKTKTKKTTARQPVFVIVFVIVKQYGQSEEPTQEREERLSSLRLSRATRRKPKGNFRNYKVWQDAVEYSVKIYQQTDKMPWFNCVDSCRDSTMLKRA